MSAPFCEWIPEEDDDRTIEQLRAAVSAEPDNPYLTERLANWINNEIAGEPASHDDQLLEKIRALGQQFQSHERIALTYVVALANSASEAVSDEVMERNERLLAELQSVIARTTWCEFAPDAIDLTIMGYQYFGLVGQRRYAEADQRLVAMNRRTAGGSHDEITSWCFAVRAGFWILRSQSEFERMGQQIALVREFQQRHPDETCEISETLLAILLGAFEVYEQSGDAATAEAYLAEANELAPIA